MSMDIAAFLAENRTKPIGKGVQHAVFRMSEDKVLKLPHPEVPGFRNTIRGWLHTTLVDPFVRQTPDTARRNAARAKHFFAGFMAPSEVVAGVREGSYGIVQDYVEYERLAPADVHRDPSLRSQLQDVMGCHQELMKEEGVLLDVMGCRVQALVALLLQGQGSSENIVRVKGDRLVIIDDGMFPLPGTPGAVPGHAHAIQWFQEQNMHAFLGAPEKGKAWFSPGQERS